MMKTPTNYLSISIDDLLLLCLETNFGQNLDPYHEMHIKKCSNSRQFGVPEDQRDCGGDSRVYSGGDFLLKIEAKRPFRAFRFELIFGRYFAGRLVVIKRVIASGLKL